MSEDINEQRELEFIGRCVMLEVTMKISVEELNSVTQLGIATSVPPGVLLQAALDYGLRRVPQAIGERLMKALDVKFTESSQVEVSDMNEGNGS